MHTGELHVHIIIIYSQADSAAVTSQIELALKKRRFDVLRSRVHDVYYIYV